MDLSWFLGILFQMSLHLEGIFKMYFWWKQIMKWETEIVFKEIMELELLTV